MGDPSRVRVTGPVEPYASSFAAELTRLGYTRSSTANQLQLLAHLSRWLATEGLGVAELTPAVSDAFLATRRAAGYRLLLSPQALVPLLRHLRGLGATPAEPAVEPSRTDAMLARYREYLTFERGLTAATSRGYADMVRPFLRTREGLDGTLELERLAAPDITAFVLAAAPGRRCGPAKLIVTALRSLLGFLHVEGVITHSLTSAVPSVAGSRLAGLPKALRPGQVRQLLASCDRSTAVGRRDFAILTMLVRLGLRAGEITALELGDVDWRGGEIIVRGKGDRRECLPLPVDVGRAVAAYLRRGRPTAECRRLFLRVRAPHRALTTSGVSTIVSGAAHKAGFPPVGAHRLRHTAATEMLHAGAPLSEIGQVLRHRSPLSTAIYAKVDRRSQGAGTAVAGWRCSMTPLRPALKDYLTMRRALGYKLQDAEQLLADFVGYAETAASDRVTIDLAIAWATLPVKCDVRWWSRRLSAVRGFAIYLHTLDTATEVPPTDLLPARSHRAVPYLYSDEDIVALMAATEILNSPLRVLTYQTLVPLLAVTGMRVGEAIRLDRNDLDFEHGLLTVRLSKFGRSRELPLHTSTLDALRAYLQRREQLHPGTTAPSLFISTAGTRLLYCNVNRTFHSLLRKAGLKPRSTACRPRLHDLRHSFAVRTVIDAYRADADVAARLPLLSTYLGHVHPSDTYWYLSAAPELLALAGKRLERSLEVEEPS